jgi:hypothetical protein
MKNTGNTIVASDGTTAVLSESSGTVTFDADVSTIGSATISGGSISGTEIDLKSSGTTIFASDGTTAVLSESGGVVTLTADEANVGSNALVVNSSGNVGIGTSLPTQALVVSESSTPTIQIKDGLASGTRVSGRLHIGETDTLGVSIENSTVSFNDNCAMVFKTTPPVGTITERMRIDSSGNVLVGGTSPFSPFGAGITLANNGEVYAERGAHVFTANRTGSDGTIVDLRKDGTTVGTIGTGGADIYLANNSGMGIYLESSGTNALCPCDSGGNLSDNTKDLGQASYRWNECYLQNGVTTGSDANEKTEITTSELGLDFINKINPVSYKFIGRYRTHYGMISQEIETLLSDVGKTSMDFAGFIKSPVTDDDGNETGEYRYGLRYTEFISPMIKAIQEQQTIIESQQSQIDALITKTQEQDLTIASLISRIEALETT